MRASHIYPVALVVVILILGVAAYAHWHTSPVDQVVTPSGMASSTDATTSDQAAASATAVGQTAGSDTGTAQVPGTYTAAQVATHANASSCWTSINGGVYDVTSWINQHPGGPDRILSLCGHDGTAAFTAQHNGQARPQAELASFKIGTLVQ